MALPSRQNNQLELKICLPCQSEKETTSSLLRRIQIAIEMSSMCHCAECDDRVCIQVHFIVKKIRVQHKLIASISLKTFLGESLVFSDVIMNIWVGKFAGEGDIWIGFDLVLNEVLVWQSPHDRQAVSLGKWTVETHTLTICGSFNHLVVLFWGLADVTGCNKWTLFSRFYEIVIDENSEKLKS